MNRLKKWTAIMLGTAMVLIGGARPALAAGGNVEYVGGAAGFVLLPDNNLWGNLQHLLPGDVVTESIAIANRSSVACDLYLTTRSISETTPLMSLLELRIALVNAQGQQTELYNGIAAGSGTAIHLGRYAAGSSATLIATLTVPTTLGNEYQHVADSTVWRFAATEYQPPSGGDDDDDDDDVIVVVKTPTAVKVGAAGMLPATGYQPKL